MLALTDKKTYSDPQALNDAVNQVFMVQTCIASLVFVFSIFNLSLGLVHFMTIVMSVVGYLVTRQHNPENWKFLTAPAIFLFLSGVFGFLGYLFSFKYTMWSFLVILIRTGITLFQSVAVFILWRTLQEQSIQGGYFYLNFIVMNKNEVLEAKVKDKMGFAGNRPIGKFAGYLAGKAVSDKTFCRKIMANMEKDIPEKMRVKGITATAKAVFSKRNFFVMKLTISGIDLPRMVEGKSEDGSGAEKATKIREILAKLPAIIREEIEFILNLVIAGGMVKNMPRQMMEEMKAKAGMEVEVFGKTHAEQADFFYEVMETFAVKEDTKEPETPSKAESVKSAGKNPIMGVFGKIGDVLTGKGMGGPASPRPSVQTPKEIEPMEAIAKPLPQEGEDWWGVESK